MPLGFQYSACPDKFLHSRCKPCLVLRPPCQTQLNNSDKNKTVVNSNLFLFKREAGKHKRSQKILEKQTTDYSLFHSIKLCIQRVLQRQIYPVPDNKTCLMEQVLVKRVLILPTISSLIIKCQHCLWCSDIFCGLIVENTYSSYKFYFKLVQSFNARFFLLFVLPLFFLCLLICYLVLQCTIYLTLSVKGLTRQVIKHAYVLCDGALHINYSEFGTSGPCPLFHKDPTNLTKCWHYWFLTQHCMTELKAMCLYYPYFDCLSSTFAVNRKRSQILEFILAVLPEY